MKFLNIEYLFLFWVLPVLALAYLYGWRKRGKILKAYAVQATLGRIVPAGMVARRRLKAVMVLGAMLLLVATMAGPQYGFKWQTVERQGIDIVLALDCSRSMLATDIQPTRLDRAKREIYDLLTMLEGDRVGLVAFSGTAFLQCPLTMDYSAFYLFLDVLSPDYLPVGGSDLGAAVQTAHEAFDPESKADRAIILITDGENTGESDPHAMAKETGKAGIKLFCIGVGSSDGVPVPNPDGGFKKDASGEIVLSRLDQGLLSRMALATGGTYVQSVAGDMDLDAIYHDQIRAKLETTTVKSGRKQVWNDRFQWPLAIAVLLLLIAAWVPAARQPLLAFVLPVLLLSHVSTVQAGPLQQGYKSYEQGDYDKALENYIQGQLQAPDDPKVLYNLGNTYYKKGDFGTATDHYKQALSGADDALKPNLLYNLGNSIYRQGNLKEAIENYEAALELAPEDQQARDNLAFVKKQMEQQQQQQQQKDNSDQPQDDNSQKQQGENGQPQEQKQNNGQSQQGQDEQKQPPQYGSEMEQPPAEQNKEQSDPQEAPQDQGAAAQKQGGKKQPPDPTAATQMLNRLKDQPGKAMMPDYQKRAVDKDW